MLTHLKNNQANTKKTENQQEEPTTCFVIPQQENPVTNLAFDYTELKLVIKETLKNDLITAIFIIAPGYNLLPQTFR